MLVFHPAFYLSSYILPRDPQERLRSNKPLNRTVPSELVGDFISSHFVMPRDPIQPHSVPGRNIIQRLLALSYHPSWCSIVVCERKGIQICFSSLLPCIRNKWKAVFTGTIEDINWVTAYQIQKLWLCQHRLSLCYFLGPAANLFNDQYSHMWRHIKTPPLEIHFLYI